METTGNFGDLGKKNFFEKTSLQPIRGLMKSQKYLSRQKVIYNFCNLVKFEMFRK